MSRLSGSRLLDGWLGGTIRRLFQSPQNTALVRSEVAAMMMVTRDIGPYIGKMSERIAEWQERRAQRRRLIGLDDRALRDIGISRADAEREYREPFWR